VDGVNDAWPIVSEAVPQMTEASGFGHGFEMENFVREHGSQQDDAGAGDGVEGAGGIVEAGL
jgi:hypothetical protein